MKILIVEDEYSVAQNLCDLLKELEPDIQVLAILETVSDALHWLPQHPNPDLGFFDIRIADGDSFEIFEKTKVDFPVIFTTAYDEYALRAFKVNSVDYLLKPVDEKALAAALKKYKSIYSDKKVLRQDDLLEVFQDLRSASLPKYKKSFLVYIKDKILPVSVKRIAYFQLENEIVFCYTHKNEKYLLDQSLDKIEAQLDPDAFFRANRQFIIARTAVKSAVHHFHRKLKLELSPRSQTEVFVSKNKAGLFKKWLEM